MEDKTLKEIKCSAYVHLQSDKEKYWKHILYSILKRFEKSNFMDLTKIKTN